MTHLLESSRLRLAVYALLLAAGSAAALAAGGPSATDIDRAASAAGIAAPLAFVAIYAGMIVLLFPGAVGSAAAGALFGVALGTAVTVLGATLGATAAFHVARRLGRDRVERIAGLRTRRLDAWLARNGFVAVLYARLIPVLPFNGLNYVCGVSGVRPREYVAATAIGIVPGSFAYVALGSSLGDPLSAPFLASAGLIVVLAVAGPLAARRIRTASAPQPTAPPTL